MHSFNKAEIPSIFKSHSGEYFERCISCSTYLLAPGTPYLIEKAVKKYPGYEATDVVFEYAMCMDCAMKMRNELSKESLINIQQYFETRADLLQRQAALEDDHDPQHWLSHCIVTGRPMTDLHEYQIYAFCDGKNMHLSGMPYMLSGEAAEEMSALLSEKTKGEIDRFIDDNFGLPPELKKHIKDQPMSFFNK